MRSVAGRARLTGAQEIAYVRQRASQLGVDPDAAEAVGAAEGGYPGVIGDNGTSFGPFQLHERGQLPGGLAGAAADLWANTQAGLDYALGKIAQVARGLRGQAAVDAIVTGFEKPADGGVGDRQRAGDYMRTHSRAGRQVRWTGVSLEGVNPTLIASVAAAVAEVGGIAVQVTSGKRAPGAGNDVSNSNHITGDALDGFVIFKGGRSVPLGTAIKPVVGKYGLRSGDVAGFDPAKPGGFDPVHVDDGANVGGPSTATPVRARPDGGQGDSGGGVLGWLGGIADGPANAAEQGFEGLFGGGISDLAGVFKGLVWLMNPRSWLRMVEFITGVSLMVLGLNGLAVLFLLRSPAAGKAASAASMLPGGAGVAGRAVTAARNPAAAARRTQAQRRREGVAAERRQRMQERLEERRQRDALDLHYRANADELDERRRARKQLREQSDQERRERVGAARRETEEVPF